MTSTRAAFAQCLDARSSNFEGIGDAERAIKPSALRHRIGVRADENRRRVPRGASEHGAKPVDARIESELDEARAQPQPPFEVGRRERGPMHASTAAPDVAERFERRQQPCGIDFNHGPAAQK